MKHLIWRFFSQKKNQKRTFVFLIALFILGFGYYLGGGFNHANKKLARMVWEEFQKVNEIASMNYNYTYFAKREVPGKLFGTDDLVYLFDGTIKMGIDASQTHIEPQGNTLTITLPEIQILSHEIHNDSYEVLSGESSKQNMDDFIEYQADDKLSAEEWMTNDRNGLSMAKENLEEIISASLRTILHTVSTDDTEYTIEFNYKENDAS